MPHTILLIQQDFKPSSRTYSDFESVHECMEWICGNYEDHLKRKYYTISTITYEISDLFKALDGLEDISVLVYQQATNTYLPLNKEWIKQKLYKILRDQAKVNISGCQDYPGGKYHHQK